MQRDVTTASGPTYVHLPDGRAADLAANGADRDGLNHRVNAVETLPPFLINVVSNTDLWLYASSTGAITAGRNNEDRSLFPYETDDKLHQQGGITGPSTVVCVELANGDAVTWRPFTRERGTRRSLSKPTLGDALRFEETHDALGLTFRYTWQACNEFGWVRTCELVSTRKENIRVRVLDGVLNLLPAGASLALQRSGSCLVNAYSQAELDLPSNLAIYSLASQIVDRAEPAEALHANVAFQVGLHEAKYLLSADQVDAFVDGEALEDEHLLTGRRPAFLVASHFELDAGSSKAWRVVLDAHRSQSQVAALQTMLNTESVNAIQSRIDSALSKAHRHLERVVAHTDGQQFTADAVVCTHHASNVLFNDLRGGVFFDQDRVSVSDFRRALTTRNQAVVARHLAWLDELPETIRYADLLSRAADTGDPQLLRLTMEYLPLTFGRRHGDPSRPWNRFDIRVIDDAGSPILNYQGNWRDIFQNWEALVLGTPVFVESMIAKFVNASTLDGFNPYRVTRDGIEWEVLDPNDVWGHIGYWGDHQIIYLLKLLEHSRRVHPARLDQLLATRAFAYANVPYLLKPFAAMLRNRHETIEFDWTSHRQIEARLPKVGTDARLVCDDEGDVLLVTLAEKLLVPALSKLSSFVAGGGIWMNTQRPEWNDANNALVGNGLSVVTLAYLRRYLAFCSSLFAGKETVELRPELVAWLERLHGVFASHQPKPDDAAHRLTVLTALGEAFEAYRETSPSTHGVAVPTSHLASFFAAALRHVDATLIAQKRRDGLYHAYNLMRPTDGTIDVSHLPMMLEGQVAAISCGLLPLEEVADVVERMFASPLWREDQQSFVLYPIVELPGFLQKNCVNEMSANQSALARQLLQSGDRSILHRDPTGQIRFNANFRNVRDVDAALDRLARYTEWSSALAAGRQEIVELYEATFGHHAFTGRSGSMYGYEGIGCIYWHMVAKLLLAVQENVQRAVDENAPQALRDRLANLYDRVRAGLGFNKTPETYGAFPLDAYSHTPLHAGAQQPGMTGQVKEEILTRFGELGVRLVDGCVRFSPTLLHAREFLDAPATWSLVDLHGTRRAITLEKGSLGFTLAGVPIVYRMTDEPASPIRVLKSSGAVAVVTGDTLDRELSAALLSRHGGIDRVDVDIPRSALRFTQISTPGAA